MRRNQKIIELSALKENFPSFFRSVLVAFFDLKVQGEIQMKIQSELNPLATNIKSAKVMSWNGDAQSRGNYLEEKKRNFEER